MSQIFVITISFFCWLGDQDFTAQALDDLTKKATVEIDAIIDQSAPIDSSNLNKATKKISKGIQAHEKGDFEKALKLYYDAIELVPTNANAYYELGFTFSSKGEQLKALECVIKALVLDPKMENAYVCKANILDNLGLSDLAIQEYKKLLDIEPNSLMGQLNLGISLVRMGNADEAKSALNRAVEIAPEHPSAYLHLANLANQLGDREEEIRKLKKFIEVGQDDRRLPMVKQWLKEAESTTIHLDPEHPYPAIDMLVEMKRAQWKQSLFKERFPSETGYHPTWEEEYDICRLILDAWKEEKQSNPDSTFPLYDYYLQAEEAGQLEPFIYFLNRDSLPDAEEYIASNKEKVDSFIAWGKQVGVISQEEPEKETEPSETPSLFQTILKLTEESDITYEIGLADLEASVEFKKKESKRFQKSWPKHKEGELPSLRTVKSWLKDLAAMENPKNLKTSFLVLLPQDEEWLEFSKLITNLGFHIPVRPIPVIFPGGLGNHPSEVKLDPGTFSWLPYWVSKSAYKMEPLLREACGEDSKYTGPTFVEEFVAFQSLVEGYSNSKDSKDHKPDPFLDYLVQVQEAECLKGFVLFEVIHNYYGVRFKGLTADQSDEIDSYLNRFVIIKN